MPYRIAFLTDIHGNLHGLEAVLREVRQAAPDLVLVGGDLTYQFPYPRESLELLATVHWLIRHQGVRSRDEAVVQTHLWNDRKKRFSPRQIGLAYDHLLKNGWAYAVGSQ